MKILHGPNNITGAPKKLADLERKKGLFSDSFNTTVLDIDGPSHFNSNDDLFSKVIFRIKYFFLAITYYNVLNFHAGASFLPFNLDLPILRLLRKKIIFHYYGSEVRIIKDLQAVNPFFDYLKEDGKNNSNQDFKKLTKLKWQSIWADYAVAPRDSFYFISQIYKEEKILELWSANILDESFISLMKKELIPQKKVPTIIHCPTNRLTKGSSFVEQAIKNLKNKGYKFTYKSIETMDKQDLQQFIRDEADIVIDQFLIGTFGNLAIESLALGKICVGYLNEELCLQFSQNCPIVNASIDSLESKMEELLKDFNLREVIAKKGPIFINKKIDEDSIIKELIKLYN